jgi:hypothetical protein
LRAHEASVVAAASERFAVFVNANADGEIRVWSFDQGDFAVGQIAIDRWRIDDRATWARGDAGAPADFAAVVEVCEAKIRQHNISA